MDEFFTLDEDARHRALGDLANSNFGVADRRLLDELYAHHYEGVRSGHPRIGFLNGHAFMDAKARNDVVCCRVRDLFSGAIVERDVDGLILATGYTDTTSSLLEGLDPLLLRDKNGRHVLRRDYQIETAIPLDAAVYLHGARQDRFGPAEFNLSILAYRGGILLQSLQRQLASGPRMAALQ